MTDIPPQDDARKALEEYMELAREDYAAVVGAEELDSEYIDIVVSQIAKYADQTQHVPVPEIVLGISSALTEFVRGQIMEAEAR